MELTQYIRLFRRWFWLLFLAAFVGGSISYVVRSSEPPQYRSSATIIIGNTVRDPDPNSSEMRIAQDLTQTYARLVNTYDIRQAVVDELSLNISPDSLGGRIDTRILDGTSLLVIQVTYNDPILAADIANEVAEQLIATSPTNLTPDQEAQVEVANTQVEQLTGELVLLREQLDNINRQIADASDSEDTNQLSTRRSDLIDQINQTTANIAQFTAIASDLQQRTNSIQIVETARIPDRPIGTDLIDGTILGALVSAVLVGALLIIYEYFRDTVETAEEVSQVLGTTVLGVISRIKAGRSKEDRNARLLMNLPPLSQTVEEYNTLRANLTHMLKGDDSRVKTLLVTSPLPEEGKSTTATNLAVSLSWTWSHVLLIDADLRRPQVHEVLKLPNDKGLTSLLAADPFAEGDGSETPYKTLEDLGDFVQETGIPGLSVITSGFPPQNPNEILSSALMKRWVEVFRNMPEIDAIIFDTPPCLTVSDSTVLAGNIDSKVVMVVQSGKTRRNAAVRAMDRFSHIRDKVIGVVLNASDPRFEDYYGYGYSSYGQYYESMPKLEANANGNGRSPLPELKPVSDSKEPTPESTANESEKVPEKS